MKKTDLCRAARAVNRTSSRCQRREKCWRKIVAGKTVKKETRCSLCSVLSIQEIRIQWSPNTETDLAGYKVYVGTSPRTYGAPITIGKITDYVITPAAGLAFGQTYYIAVTAYNAAGFESGYSNEVSTMIPAAPLSEPLSLHVVLTVATTATTAAVAWQTSTLTDAVIEYGLTDPPATRKVIDTALITDHLAKLTGLTAKKAYFYKISSKDAAGQVVTATGTFITK